MHSERCMSGSERGRRRPTAATPHGAYALLYCKGRWKLMRLITQYPERAAWWIEQERFRRSVARKVRKPELTRFLMRYTYEDLKNTPMMPFDELREEREATEAVSCFCGD